MISVDHHHHDHHYRYYRHYHHYHHHRRHHRHHHLRLSHVKEGLIRDSENRNVFFCICCIILLSM